MKKRMILAVLLGLSAALSSKGQAPDSAQTPKAPDAPATAPVSEAPKQEHAVKEVAPAPEVTSSVPLATPAEPAAQAAPALSSEPNAAAASGPVAKSGKETLTVDFADDDIRTILRNVADLFDLNLVIPETLQGKASIKLRDVTWRQIFKVLLGPVNYTYVEDGNIIRIVTSDSLNQEPAVTEIFVLNYAKASDVKPSIDNLVDAKAGGKIVIDARTNSLIVSERPSVIGKIRPIVNQLDRATDQVMIETKFIDVTQGDTKNLGINWSSLSNYKIGTEKAITREYEQTDVLGASPSNKLSKVTSAVLTADQFSLVLSAINSLDKAKLVSNPTVVTLNNMEATINIGRDYPIPNYTYNQERGVFEVSGFNYKSIGVNLKVTPQVNTAGYIRLTVEPEVSSSNESVSFGGSGGAQIPIIQVRRTKTQITIKDGFTLGLGGLVEHTVSDNKVKLPVLGDVPGLGRLFRSNNKTVTDHNLVVFITAKTIKPDGAETGEVFDPRMTRQMELQKSDLPGYRDGSDPYWTPPPPEEKKK